MEEEVVLPGEQNLSVLLKLVGIGCSGCSNPAFLPMPHPYSIRVLRRKAKTGQLHLETREKKQSESTD